MGTAETGIEFGKKLNAVFIAHDNVCNDNIGFVILTEFQRVLSAGADKNLTDSVIIHPVKHGQNAVSDDLLVIHNQDRIHGFSPRQLVHTLMVDWQRDPDAGVFIRNTRKIKSCLIAVV